MKTKKKLALLLSFQLLFPMISESEESNIKVDNLNVTKFSSYINDVVDKNQLDNLNNGEIDFGALQNMEADNTFKEETLSPEIVVDYSLEDSSFEEKNNEQEQVWVQDVEINVDLNEIEDIFNENEGNEYLDIENSEIIEEYIGQNDIFEQIEVQDEYWQNEELSIIDKILEDENFLGNVGRLYFADLSSVGLNYVSLKEEEYSQSVVDAIDSAAIFEFGNSTVIADHNNQAFRIFKDIKVNDYAYIKKENNIIDSYICSEVIKGINTGYDLIDDNGRSIQEMTDCDIIMYTCNYNWQNVIITLWKHVSEPEKILKKI